MRAVLQRVTSASVTVDSAVTGHIGQGIVALIGVTHDDSADDAAMLAKKIAYLRILDDEKSLIDVGGEVLVVSQFTLYADTKKGRRPSWQNAAPGQVAEPLYEAVCDELGSYGLRVARGVFGAHMELALVNDGPVTILLET